MGIALEDDVVGHESLRRYGTTVRPELLDKARNADGLILGPTATFDFKDPAKGEINPSMFFRKNLDLFANIRPARTYPGVPGQLGAFDLVIARENTEGFYADRNMAQGNAEMLVTDDVAISLRRITRHVLRAHRARRLRAGRHAQDSTSPSCTRPMCSSSAMVCFSRNAARSPATSPASRSTISSSMP